MLHAACFSDMGGLHTSWMLSYLPLPPFWLSTQNSNPRLVQLHCLLLATSHALTINVVYSYVGLHAVTTSYYVLTTFTELNLRNMVSLWSFSRPLTQFWTLSLFTATLNWYFTWVLAYQMALLLGTQLAGLQSSLLLYCCSTQASVISKFSTVQNYVD